jgi:hypothetical protein
MRVFRSKLPRQFGNHRPWSDQAHVAAENVPQLGKLIELPSPQPGSESSDAGVRSESDSCALFTIAHGTQFQYLKATKVAAHPALAVEDRALRIEFEEYGKQDKKRKQNDQCRPGERDVDGPFEHTFSWR